MHCKGRFDSRCTVQKAYWLICLWRRAADVFMKNAGYQALIGEAFLAARCLSMSRSAVDNRILIRASLRR